MENRGNGKIGGKWENRKKKRKIRGNGKLENKKGKIGGYLIKVINHMR